MEAYTSFARVYDTFMDNIPYEEWCEYLTGLMREYGVRDGLVLDLGCGHREAPVELVGVLLKVWVVLPSEAASFEPAVLLACLLKALLLFRGCRCHVVHFLILCFCVSSRSI